jgi:hypothetical protein
MSKIKKYYELYKTQKSSFKTDTSYKVIWQWDNLYNFKKLKPAKNRSGNLWTKDGILFVDEIPLAVNLGKGRDCIYVHSIYLDKLPDVSYVKRYAKEIQRYLDMRPPQGKSYMPLSIDIINEVAESVLK